MMTLRSAVGAGNAEDIFPLMITPAPTVILTNESDPNYSPHPGVHGNLATYSPDGPYPSHIPISEWQKAYIEP